MRLLLVIFLALMAPSAWSVGLVNPFGVNVRSSGPSTVFLTFQNLDAGERAVEAFWCGELNAGLQATNANLQAPFPVQNANPCQAGTIYGRLPIRLDRSQVSNSGAFRNLTDIMTIPASVSRRAYQDARAGKNSAFFYVRRFTGGVGGDKFVIVTCRMSGGGVRNPMSLIDVRVAFDTDQGRVPVLAVARDQVPPSFSAEIHYNGTGLLRGRWEVVLPGDQAPTEDDLLTEATLPVERRAQQRRYTLIDRFAIFLPPTGKVTIPGPNPKRLPRATDGPYQVLLRIEATNEKESRSNTGGGRLAFGGAAAGFPMPVLRYYVGTSIALGQIEQGANGQKVRQFLPGEDAQLNADDELSFQWVDINNAALYRLEVRSADEVQLSALVKPGVSNYAAPTWFVEEVDGVPLRWRVSAIGKAGGVISSSSWRKLTIGGS